jgi:hypothetical protein
MQTEHAGEDASLDSAVQAIMAKMPSQLGKTQEPAKDTRQNRVDRDPTEMDEYQDLDALEAAERLDKRDGLGEEAPDQDAAESEEAPEANASDDGFIELPAAEEGKEPERVPLSEAVEAVQKLRQMEGEIATAVIRAEEEAFNKQDQITQALDKTFQTVREQARVALEMMHLYAPAQPDPILLDENSGYYDPAYYHKAKIQYDNFLAHYNQVKNTLKQVEGGRNATGSYQDTAIVQRETERTARFIPEFKDEKAREARKSEIFDALNKRYGVTKEELADIVDHKAWRMMNDLTKLVSAEKKAPEVRKQIQEKAPKLVRGRLPDRDNSSGKFIGDARKAHREQGSEESLARLLISSGKLKGL